MPFKFEVIAFAVATLGFAWLTRSSLRSVRSHGLYRFFAWEAIVVLALLNLDWWFHEPLSPRQLASWSLLTICSYLVVHGALLLRRVGKPDPSRKDSALLGIEKTTELVTVGAYRYIRHPLYGSLLFLAWGVFFKHPSGPGMWLAMIATFFLVVTAKIEEAENIRFFGATYQDYMKQTKMFIPFLF